MVSVLRLDILISILNIKLLQLNISVSAHQQGYDKFGFEM